MVHSKKTTESERYIALCRQLEEALAENERLRNQLEGRDDDDPLIQRNQKLKNELAKTLKELRVVGPIADEHTKHCKVPEHSEEQSTSRQVKFKDTPDSDRLAELTRQLEEALEENERLRKELEGFDDNDALKRQNQRLEEELNKALLEMREMRPIVEEHTRNCGVTNEDNFEEEEEYYEPEDTQVKSLPRSIASQSQRSKELSTKSWSNKGPEQDYVSRISQPPSEYCEEPMDNRNRNVLLTSKDDFETLMRQKKQYSMEMNDSDEPMNDKQTLNCKLEICMYDLEVNGRMLDYLTSKEQEPKVYVEWSFVGLDQRTAPLPAQQALFYTNVMYYGPLSKEIKHYLHKVEMPVDLYLVRSSSAPLKVAMGSLDMLPAMEQPNRGFMRSINLWGDPNTQDGNKVVGTIHCSFLLHDCCFGDLSTRDQVEVGIGTLYLKNRDGGVVPDHATHIYVEYAIMGHCGPELETDSAPRGEVMKFNHTKKLKVRDDNAPYLKAMLKDVNPKPLSFRVLAEPCSLTTDTEVETVGLANVNLNEEMIRRGRDLISSQVPVYDNEGENLGTLSVTVLGIDTLQQIYRDDRVPIQNETRRVGAGYDPWPGARTNTRTVTQTNPWYGTETRTGTEISTRQTNPWSAIPTIPWNGTETRTGTQTLARTGTQTSARTGTQTSARTGTQTSSRTGTKFEARSGTLTNPWYGTETRTGTQITARSGTQTIPWYGTETRTGTQTSARETNPWSATQTNPWNGTETRTGTQTEARTGTQTLIQETNPWSEAQTNPWYGTETRTGTQIEGRTGTQTLIQETNPWSETQTTPWYGAETRTGTQTEARTGTQTLIQETNPWSEAQTNPWYGNETRTGTQTEGQTGTQTSTRTGSVQPRW